MSTHISTLVWQYEPLKGADLLLAVALADMANDEGQCWPSLRSLAARLRVSPDNVRKRIRRLEELGVLSVEIRARANGSIQSNNYLFDLALLRGETAGDTPAKTRGYPSKNEGVPQQKRGGDPSKNEGGTPAKTMPLEPSIEPSIEPSEKQGRSRAAESPPTGASDPRPWDLLDACFRAQGVAPEALFGQVKTKQLAIAKRLIAAEMVPGDVEAITRWLLGQGWIREGIDLFMVEQFAAKWVASGKPAGTSPHREPDPFEIVRQRIRAQNGEVTIMGDVFETSGAVVNE